jgi:hypothetical protein
MIYIVLRGCWFNYIVLNMQAPSEEKSDDSKGSFYGELEQVPYENSIRRLKCKSGETDYFQTDNWE